MPSASSIFLTLGGGIVLAAALLTASLWRRSLAGPTQQRWNTAWSALIPGVLGASVVGPAIAADQLQACRQRIDQLTAALPARARNDLRRLFLLGDLPGVRRAAFGMPVGWADLTPQQTGDLLDQWSRGADQRLQLAARSLRSIVRMAWYSQSTQWQAIGYPGPPNLS